jgi:hypothetical protein
MKITLISPTNKVKEVPTGFSWTYLLFGPLVSLFRADFVDVILYFVAYALLAYFIPQSGAPGLAHYIAVMLNLIGSATYNNGWIRRHVYKGWRAATPLDIQKLTSLHIKVGKQ